MLSSPTNCKHSSKYWMTLVQSFYIRLTTIIAKTIVSLIYLLGWRIIVETMSKLKKQLKLAFVPIYSHWLMWTHREGAVLKLNAYNEIYSGNSYFCQLKTILEYSGLTTDIEIWTHAVETPASRPTALTTIPNCRLVPINYDN